MQEWDRVAMLFVGLGVAGYTLYQGWQLWRQANRKAAVGAAVLAVATVGVPAVLALLTK